MKLIFGSVTLTAIMAIVFFLFLKPLIYGTIDDLIKSRTKATVEIGHSVILKYYNDYLAGRYSEEEAKRLALESLRNAKYLGDEYFWVNNYDPVMLMHPFRPELENQPLHNYQDPNGVYLFMNVVKTVKEKNEGFVRYSWNRPNETEPQPKISYVKGFKEWDMIIGSGTYVDDINTIKNQIFWGVIIAFIILLVFIIAILIYIANRKQVEKVLIESEEKLRTTLHSIGDGVITTDERGLIEDMNPIAEKLCGWSLADARGKSLTEVFYIVHAQTHKPAESPVKKVFETGKVVGLANHTMLISKEGSKYQIADSAAPITRTDGKITGVVLVFSDVTENYLMSEKLRISEERLDLAMSVKNEGIWDWHLDTDETYFDDRYYTMAGYYPNEFPQNFDAWSERIHPDDLPNAEKSIEKYLSGESDRFEVEFRFKRKDGDWIWIHSKGKIVEVDENGKPMRLIGTHTDITDRKLAEEELLLFKESLDNSRDAIGMSTPEGKHYYQNDAFTELFGDVGNNPTKNLFADKEIGKDVFNTIMSGDSWTGEVEMISRQGHILNIYLRAFANKDKKGNVKGLVGIHTDITERKKAEESLKSNYELLRIAGETARFGGWNVDLEKNICIWSDAVADIHEMPHGYSPPVSEAINFYAPEWREKITKVFNDCAEKGIPYDEEFQIITSKGKRVWVRSIGKAVKDENGRICKLHGSFQDITEIKRAEQVRKVQYEIAMAVHYANTIEELLEIIRQKIGQIMDTTNFIVALYNPDKDSLKQMIFRDEMDDYEEWSASESISGQVVKSGNTILLKGDELDHFSRQHNLKVLGTETKCWLGVPILIQGAGVGVMVIQHYSNSEEYDESDAAMLEMIAHETGIFIEKHRMIEELVTAKEKAEESDRLKTAFLQNMNHEIRTPLNGILGFAKLLNDEDITSDEIKSYTDIILQSGKRLMETVGNVLDISRIDTGQVEINNKEFSINSLMAEMHSFFSIKANSKNLKLSYNSALDYESSIIKSDEIKINQVLTNLINNALKFTESGGIDYGYRVLNDEIEFYVKDTGIGIPEDFKRRIFSRFNQADLESTRKYGGAGLGLSICKGLVELLGGKLWFESEYGKGTTFFFTIPYSPVASIIKSEEQRVEIDTDLRNIKILVVEDDSASSIYLNKLLSKFEPDILNAKNGKEALELFKNNNIDLILMDIRMPTMDGFTATKLIKEIKPDMPIIAQSAYASNEEIREYLQHFDDYITKPFDLKSISNILNKFLEKRKKGL